ncbi:hypothetical protein Ocin01_07515 [Orchesella cincta]|uniref:Uncharacterized protein n=1 Tax=Orchesella cincta TaxID=48709 RepID=A0A1D2N289_ORCCI|nr:hypothetical protein Ocin01_07515 [Orchesella cincta]
MKQTTIKFTPATTVGSTVGSSNNITSPVSIQPVVSAVSSSSPMISTIFYQIPASSVTSHGTTTGTAVMSPSFTIIPAHNGPRAMIPLPINTPLVKLEPGTGGGQNTVNWNNIQLVKVPRTSIDSNGVTTFSTLAPATALTTSTLLPSPGKGDGGGKSSLVTGADGKSPTKSRARRRSQSTTKGQSRGSSRVSSGSSDIVIPSSVEGLPNIVVDGYEITREIWAKAFLQNDIIHAAGTLFNALFSSEEIKNCTLNGRNGTRQLCPEKRHAIFRIVAWMKNKCQDPYSFNTSPEDTKILNREEQMMIEKKVFVERRYQTSRKIRDLPPTPQLPSALPTLSSIITPSSTTTTSSTTPKKNAIPERRDSGSFSSVCSIGDEKGIPKIALIQSSEIIANYFQNAEPLSTTSVPTPASSLLHHDVGPPPMKMQKVG